MIADLHKAESCDAAPSHSLSSHLCEGFQMTGPQDRPIWCGMTDSVFPAWLRKTVQKGNEEIQHNSLWFRLSEECPMLRVLLCPFLPSLCRLLTGPPSPPCLKPSPATILGLHSPRPRPSLFHLLYLKNQPSLPLC